MAAMADANVFCIDGLDMFGKDDVGELADGFHPTEHGYEKLGERLAEAVLRPCAADVGST